MNVREYQQTHVRHTEGRVLNAASACDPHGLRFICGPRITHLDIQTHDPAINVDNTFLENFIPGTVMDMPFKDGEFGQVVLGEFLEHCDLVVALGALKECSRVLVQGGVLTMTIPFDRRTRAAQGELQKEFWAPGVTSWHSHVWIDQEFTDLFAKTGFRILHHRELVYWFSDMFEIPVRGLGICLAKI